MATTGATTSDRTSSIYESLNGTSKKKTATTTEDVENRFLTLLTTQLKNQDPLNPLDNAQVTSQLAQINTVNGIEKLNATMAKLMSAYDTSQAMQQAGLVGRQILSAGSGMALVQGYAVAGVKLEGDAEHVFVSIKDSTGKVVQTQDLGPRKAGSLSFVWDGKNDAKEQLTDGNYTFSVEAKNGDDKVKSTALQLGAVSALVRDKNGFVLDLGARGTIKFSDVEQVL